MSRILVFTIFALFLSNIPGQGLAMNHAPRTGENGSTAHQHDQNRPDAMSVEGGMFIVGDMTSKGVRGMAHLKDVREAMSKLGQATTHHFMIVFVDVETGEQIETGQAAIKIQDPDGKVSGPLELIGMQGHFGVDIVLDKPGEYHLKLGTQLADGVKRKYHFHHKVE